MGELTVSRSVAACIKNEIKPSWTAPRRRAALASGGQIGTLS
jgi:hypothetical protein